MSESRESRGPGNRENQSREHVGAVFAISVTAALLTLFATLEKIKQLCELIKFESNPYRLMPSLERTHFLGNTINAFSVLKLEGAELRLEKPPFGSCNASWKTTC